MFSVWNWKEGQLLNRFSNSNPRGTSITSVKFINEEDVAMLLVASGIYLSPFVCLIFTFSLLCMDFDIYFLFYCDK